VSAELTEHSRGNSFGLRMQDLDYAVLTDCQLLEKVLQFADEFEAVRLTLVEYAYHWRDMQGYAHRPCTTTTFLVTSVGTSAERAKEARGRDGQRRTEYSCTLPLSGRRLVVATVYSGLGMQTWSDPLADRARNCLLFSKFQVFMHPASPACEGRRG